MSIPAPGFWLPAVIAGGCALYYLAACCHRPAGLRKSLVKTASVALLALAAALAQGPALLVAALLLCALGDWWLSREGEAAFLAGVAGFAAGHLAYIALFLTRPAADLSRPAPLAVAALVLFGLVMMGLLYRHAGTLRLAVLAYVPVIVAMGLAAMTLPIEGALALVLPAALLFMASDTILATELFLLSPGHSLRRIAPFAVWALYWLAQLGFVLGLAA